MRTKERMPKQSPISVLRAHQELRGNRRVSNNSRASQEPSLHFIHHTLVLVGDEFQPGSIKTWAWTPRSKALKFQYGVISEVSSDDMKKTEVEKMRREHIFM